MKPTSIKLNLLKALIGTFFAITVITIVITFNIIKEDTNEIFDYQLKQIATIVSNTNNPSVFKNDIGDNDTELGILVFDTDGKLLANSGKRYNIKTLDTNYGFKKILYQNEILYTYTAKSKHFVIISVQSKSIRDKFVIYGSLMAIAPLILFSLIFGLLMWYLLLLGLSPLGKFGKKISEFSLENISTLQTENLPIELLPLAENINKMAKKLKQNIDNQKSFIENAAHELRTPIAALNLQADLIKKSTNLEEQKRSLELLTQGLERSNRLIEQLLILTRFEHSKENITTTEKLNLSKILSDVIVDLYFKAEKKYISFDVQKEDIYIMAMEHDIYIVYKNIIENAINYSPNNSTILIRLYKQDGFGYFEVRDTGCGIGDEAKKRVFDRFYRAGNHQSFGSGLGLSIVETICKKYDFTIELKDNLPKGVLFVVYFKLQETQITNNKR